MDARRLFAAGAAAVLVAGLGIAGAAPASAAKVWHQSVGRSSADASCPGDNANEQSQGWSKWTPSWEAWMNDGQGGWVCTRSITWARDSAPPDVSDPDSGSPGGSSECIDAGSYGYFSYDDFLAGTEFGEWLPTSSDVYSDAACTNVDGETGETVFVLTDSLGDAEDECTHHGQPGVPGLVPDADTRLYECVTD